MKPDPDYSCKIVSATKPTVLKSVTWTLKLPPADLFEIMQSELQRFALGFKLKLVTEEVLLEYWADYVAARCMEKRKSKKKRKR